MNPLGRTNYMRVYAIEFAAAASKDLAELRAFDRAAIARAIFEQLTREPTTPTRSRKLLTGVTPRFETVPPLWQLRVGEHRVFYDVDEDQKKVFVRTPPFGARSSAAEKSLPFLSKRCVAD